jgi:hypothetical protein
LSEFAAGYHRSQISPRAALGSLCSWAVRHDLAVWFTGDHSAAAAIAQRLLEAFAIDVRRREGARLAAGAEDSPRILAVRARPKIERFRCTRLKNCFPRSRAAVFRSGSRTGTCR